MTIQRWLRNHECAERLRRVSAVAGRNTTSEDCPSAPCSHRAEVVVESLAGVVPMSDVSCALEIKVTSQPAPAWTHPWERLPALEATIAPSVELKAGDASASVAVYGSKDFDDDGTRSFELRVAQCTAVNESDVVTAIPRPRYHTMDVGSVVQLANEHRDFPLVVSVRPSAVHQSGGMVTVVARSWVEVSAVIVNGTRVSDGHDFLSLRNGSCAWAWHWSNRTLRAVPGPLSHEAQQAWLKWLEAEGLTADNATFCDALACCGNVSKTGLFNFSYDALRGLGTFVLRVIFLLAR